ncbi:Protein tyrosine phosphatase domain-containing protein 1, partial [Rhizoclosmatium hyalinum]
ITPSILAMQRPSTRLLKTHNLVQVFLTAGIKSIFNLQLPNEHKSCGDGIDDRGGSGFSYVPEDWMEAGISHYAFGWPDMDVPDKSHILKVVQVMTHELEVLGGKVAVHCHAGLGRTGLTIACYLVYAQNKTPAE